MTRRIPVPSERTVQVAKAVMALAIVAVLVYVLHALWVLAGSNDDLEQQNRDERATVSALAGRVDAQGNALLRANRKLVRHGEDPVVPPPATEAGPAGADGVPGPTGPPGPKGPRGFRGFAGFAGADGSTGASGTDGLDGAPGPVGPVGPTGPQGPPGKDGAQGPQGPAGSNGADAYPFTFTFTVPASGPLDDPDTYTITCTAPSACSTS